MLSILGFQEKTIELNGTMASLIESLWMDSEKPKRKYVLPDYGKHSLDTRVYHSHEHHSTSKPIILKSFCFSPSDFNITQQTDWIDSCSDANNNTNITTTTNNNNNNNSKSQLCLDHQRNHLANHKRTNQQSIQTFSLDNVRLLTIQSDYMFPQCFFIHHLNPDRYFIAKVFPKTKKSAKARELRKEKKLWQKVSSNDNFLPLFGVLEIDNSVCLLTENVPYISLKDLIGNKCLVESDVINIAAQLTFALGYLHENNILHRGLNLHIIFINWRGLIKISDLSTCEEKGKCLSTIPSSCKFPYCAPEILLGLPYGIGSDWWSLGLIIYELLTGKVLLGSWDDSLLSKKIAKENCKDILEDMIRLSSKLPDSLSEEAKSLLKGLLERDDKKRLKWTRANGLEQIMKQPFFSSIDWHNLKNGENRGLGKIIMDLTLCSWYPDIIKIHQVLGPDLGGIWGDCHLISNHKTGEKGMMKVIWKCKMRRKRNGWKQVMNERLIWSKMSSSSPYTLPMIGFFETEATYSFVSSYIASCVSLSCVILSSPLPETVIRLVTGELALALDSVHKQGILLRHLSPDSILIEASGRIWLTDFTWAKVTKYSRKGYFEPEYMAPEVIQGLQFGKQSDWFALGIIVFQLVTGLTPLTIYCTKKGLNEYNLSTETMLRAMETIPKLLEDETFSPAIRDLLKDMLAFEPEKRLGKGRNCLKRLKEHTFFNGLVWKKLEQAKGFS